METASIIPAKHHIKWSKVVLSWYGILLAYVIIIGLFLTIRAIDGGSGNNPIALKLGGLTFRWYGVIITCGVVIASFLAQFLAERRRDDPDHVWRLLPILLITGIGLARIWYVVFTWDSYKEYIFSVGDPNHAGAIEIWRGGIAIQGAVIGGLIGSVIYMFFYNRRLHAGRTKYKNPFSIFRAADFVAPGLVLAQGIGRWGNFMNNEAYGRETRMPWGIKIPCDYRTTGITPGTVNTTCLNPDGSTNIAPDALFHPTFLYESLWDYFTFLILFFCIMKPKTIEQRLKIKLRDGDIFLLYMVVYSVGRFFTESLRTDSLYLNGSTSGIRSAQLTAIIEIVIGGFLLLYRHRKSFPLIQSLSVKLPALTILATTSATNTASGPIELATPMVEDEANRNVSAKSVQSLIAPTSEFAEVVETSPANNSDERLNTPVETEAVQKLPPEMADDTTKG